MTDVPLAEQIAAVKLEISRMAESEIDWNNSVERHPNTLGAGWAATSLGHLARMRAVLATLESVPAMLAVIEAARRYQDATDHHEELAVRGGLYAQLRDALAALPSPPQEP